MPDFPLFSMISVADVHAIREVDSWILSQPGGTWFHTIEAHLAVWNTPPDVFEFRNSADSRQVLYVTRLLSRAGVRYPKRHALLYLASPVSLADPDFSPIFLSSLAWNSRFSLVNWTFPWQDDPYPVPVGGNERFGLFIPVDPDPDRQFRSFSEQARRHLRKPLSGTFEWIPANQLTVGELSLLSDSYLAHGQRSPVSAEELAGVLSRLPDGRVTALRYQQSGQTLAWRLWIADPRGRLTDWLSAINRELAPEPTGYHLMAHSLDYARNHHINSLDMGGINTPGISGFKQRFGGVKKHGLHLLTSPNPFIRLLIRANTARHLKNKQA